MKIVKYQGRSHAYLENFPSDTSRLSDGAIHLWPGRVVDMSHDEYAYVKGQYPSIARNLIVLRQSKESA